MKSLLTIGIQDLKISCIIGTLPHERITQQVIAIDILVQKEIVRVGEDLNQTVDYCYLADICKSAAKKNYLLLETLGEGILEVLLREKSVEYVELRIRKKNVIPEAEYAYIVLEQGKKR